MARLATEVLAVPSLLPSLSHLNIVNNQITDVGAGELVQALRQIDADRTKSPNLRTITIAGNQLSDASKEELAAAVTRGGGGAFAEALFAPLT